MDSYPRYVILNCSKACRFATNVHQLLEGAQTLPQNSDQSYNCTTVEAWLIELDSVLRRSRSDLWAIRYLGRVQKSADSLRILVTVCAIPSYVFITVFGEMNKPFLITSVKYSYEDIWNYIRWCIELTLFACKYNSQVISLFIHVIIMLNVMFVDRINS